jgi:hypothetical protein
MLAAEGRAMTEADWFSDDPGAVWAMCSAVEEKSPRKVRLFCVACARRVAIRSGDTLGEAVTEVAERYADGEASIEEFDSAHQAALGLPVGFDEPKWSAACAVAIETTMAVLYPDRCVEFSTFPSDTNDQIEAEMRAQAALLRDIFGNPFRPVTFSPSWRTDTAVSLARTMYESCDFSAMPILADALQDAGCDRADILSHCRQPGEHVRGCWVVDLVLAKQ